MSDIQQIVSRQVNRWHISNKMLEDYRKDDEVEKPTLLRPIITLSRQRGSRGHELAKLLAYELQFGLFDREIIEYIAKHMGVRSELVESLDEKRRSTLEVWVSNMIRNNIFDADDYIRELGEVVQTAALQGGVIVVGRGANYMLSTKNSFHIRVIASLKTRINNLITYEDMSEKEARQEIEKRDNERAEFVERYFDKDIGETLAYDLIFNMDRIQLNPAVKSVLATLRAQGWSLEQTGGDKRKRDTT